MLGLIRKKARFGDDGITTVDFDLLKQVMQKQVKDQKAVVDAGDSELASVVNASEYLGMCKLEASILDAIKTELGG